MINDLEQSLLSIVSDDEIGNLSISFGCKDAYIEAIANVKASQNNWFILSYTDETNIIDDFISLESCSRGTAIINEFKDWYLSLLANEIKTDLNNYKVSVELLHINNDNLDDIKTKVAQIANSNYYDDYLNSNLGKSIMMFVYNKTITLLNNEELLINNIPHRGLLSALTKIDIIRFFKEQ